MEEWWTYRLSDFLLFSPRTYYRMFELYHQRIWPAHLVVLAGIAAIGFGLRRKSAWAPRAVAALLSASWLWVAIAFHLWQYASINWAAKYFAALFVVQAVLFLWYGVARRGVQLRLLRDRATYLGLGLVLIALVTVAAGVPAGRTWLQLEFPGLTPDPTVIATLGLLALSVPRVPRALLVLPIVWCLIGGATLWALGSPEAWLLLGSAVGGLTLILQRVRSHTAPARDST